MQEPQPADTNKWATTSRFGKILGTTSVVRSIQTHMIVVRYKNFMQLKNGENVHILFIHDVSSKPKDQYMRDILPILYANPYSTLMQGSNMKFDT